MTEESIPEASFLTIVHTIGIQAMIALGEIPNPVTQEKQVDLRQAKWHIDSLEILVAKTMGHLTGEEREGLTSALAEIRLTYVKKTGGNNNPGS